MILNYKILTINNIKLTLSYITTVIQILQIEGSEKMYWIPWSIMLNFYTKIQRHKPLQFSPGENA
jgi:hypothetical protein